MTALKIIFWNFVGVLNVSDHFPMAFSTNLKVANTVNMIFKCYLLHVVGDVVNVQLYNLELSPIPHTFHNLEI